jgi:hypothetical protein
VTPSNVLHQKSDCVTQVTALKKKKVVQEVKNGKSNWTFKTATQERGDCG